MLKTNRVLIASGVVLLLVIVAALTYDSPNRFGAAVVAAARNRDTLRLEQLIDFPAVSAGLKSDLKPIMAQALNQPPDSAVGQIVDQLISPVALEDLVADQPVPVAVAGAPTAPLDNVFPKDTAGVRFRVSHKYLAFGRFRYTLTNISGHSSVDIDMARTSLLGWRVERITPTISLADLKGADQAPAAATAVAVAGVGSEPPGPPPPPSDEAPPAGAQAALDTGLPTQIGQCVTTTVKEVSTRLEDTPGSGSAISFANGGYQVSYDQMPEVDASQPGDGVRMCLVSAPQDCPPGDNRGVEYKTTDLRTGQSWSLPDSEHSCGGA